MMRYPARCAGLLKHVPVGDFQKCSNSQLEPVEPVTAERKLIRAFPDLRELGLAHHLYGPHSLVTAQIQLDGLGDLERL